MPPWLDLTGRAALITGAGSPNGIGIAAGHALASLGASIALTATSDRVLDRAEELRRQGHVAHGFVCDLTDDEAGGTLIDEVVRALGRLDILVNNAGMTSLGSMPESGEAVEMTIATWRAGLARNLDTCFIATRHALPHLRRSGYGRIVNVASVTGPVMAMRAEPAYAAAKAGMIGFTRALAVDCADEGITVNAVAPGWIATGSQTEAERRQGLSGPMGRSGTAEEVASAIAWLSTPGASYVTGATLVVDGGNSVAEERAT